MGNFKTSVEALPDTEKFTSLPMSPVGGVNFSVRLTVPSEPAIAAVTGLPPPSISHDALRRQSAVS
jgi:hypothetical protein